MLSLGDLVLLLLFPWFQQLSLRVLASMAISTLDFSLEAHMSPFLPPAVHVPVGIMYVHQIQQTQQKHFVFLFLPLGHLSCIPYLFYCHHNPSLCLDLKSWYYSHIFHFFPFLLTWPYHFRSIFSCLPFVAASWPTSIPCVSGKIALI